MIVFTPTYNTPGKKDVDNAFLPEARLFVKAWKEKPTVIHQIDNRLPMNERAAAVLEYMKSPNPGNTNWGESIVAFLCHGWSNGIQLGFRSPPTRRTQSYDKKNDPRNWKELVQLIANMDIHPTVVLYCCSTGDSPDDRDDEAPGSGDNSFADQLRDDLCWAGAIHCRVIAHYTAGHCTQNPHIKIFEGRGSPYGGVGANSLTNPTTVQFKTLKKLLKTDWRFKFILDEIWAITEEIHKNC